jgi:hypothetical protein
MKRIPIALVVIVMVLTSWSVAQSDYQNVKCLDKIERCEKAQKAIHKHFGKHAHRAIGYFSCESGLKKWSRVNNPNTQYKGIVSAGSSFRATYWKSDHPWRIWNQIKAAARASRDSVARGDYRFAHWGEGRSWGCA